MLMLSLLGMLKAIEGLHETNYPGSLDLIFLICFLPGTGDPSEIANIVAFLFSERCCQMHENFRKVICSPCWKISSIFRFYSRILI